MIGHILSPEKFSLEGSAQSGVVPQWFGWSQLSRKEWESNKEEWSLIPAELVAIPWFLFHCNQLAL